MNCFRKIFIRCSEDQTNDADVRVKRFWQTTSSRLLYKIYSRQTFSFFFLWFKCVVSSVLFTIVLAVMLQLANNFHWVRASTWDWGKEGTSTSFGIVCVSRALHLWPGRRTRSPGHSLINEVLNHSRLPWNKALMKGHRDKWRRNWRGRGGWKGGGGGLSVSNHWPCDTFPDVFFFFFCWK